LYIADLKHKSGIQLSQLSTEDIIHCQSIKANPHDTPDSCVHAYISCHLHVLLLLLDQPFSNFFISRTPKSFNYFCRPLNTVNNGRTPHEQNAQVFYLHSCLLSRLI